MRDDVQVLLNALPDERPPRTTIGCGEAGGAREVSVQVPPLHVGGTEGHKAR